MTDDEVHSTLVDLSKQMQAKQQAANQKQAEANKVLGEKNRKDGDAFLAQNKGKEGVGPLPATAVQDSQRPEDGPKPTASDNRELQLPRDPD